MALVDSNYRFIWGSWGFPGNSHNAIIFQFTELWSNIKDNDIIPLIGKNVGSMLIPPLILGDSAFPFQTWLMKPFTNAVITPKQSNFNYRLSRARMVTEGAYGQLKGRWRVLLRKCESTQEKIKALDLTFDPATNGRRARARVRELLQMKSCEKMRDTSHQADKIRNALAKKLWLEKQGGDVC